MALEANSDKLRLQIIAGLALTFCLLAQESLLHAGENAAFTHLWGGFATSLTARSAQQRHNSIIAARDLDGLVIPPGGIFSFNERIGARERGKGYAAAPHIDAQGLLQDTPGGGICQLASTIYNAGLQAGMTVLERHPHSRTVGHVPPGRDATISSWRKDLKLGNPFPHPLQLRVGISRDRLSSSFSAPVPQPFRTEIITTRSQLPAETIVRSDAQTNSQAGAPGYRVTTRRITHDTSDTNRLLHNPGCSKNVRSSHPEKAPRRRSSATPHKAGFEDGGEMAVFQQPAREELLSEDIYPAPSRIIGQ